MAKILYGWDNKEFEEEYLRKLEKKNWRRWKNDRKEVEEEELEWERGEKVEKIIWREDNAVFPEEKP